MKTCSSEFLQIRGRRLHVRIWGSEAAPLLVLLHGWCDVSASWQFVVDALERDWRIVAPDWRGFGLSEGNNDAVIQRRGNQPGIAGDTRHQPVAAAHAEGHAEVHRVLVFPRVMADDSGQQPDGAKQQGAIPRQDR